VRGGISLIRIIDATLCILDINQLTKEQIYQFVTLMEQIGIRNLQISVEVYQKLEGKLPAQMTYYLELDTLSYLNKEYPDDKIITYYFTPKQKKEPREIEAYQINDLEEPVRNLPSAKDGLLKITGLDKLLLGGCSEGLEVLNKRFGLKRLILCPEDTFHCATAIATLFLQHNGYAVVSTLRGIGNKAATEQILMALHVIERYMVNQNFKAFSLLRCWLEEVQEEPISPMAPVFGTRIFYVESGIHVDGILKKAANYEPYPAELVGLEREVILGKHSGKSSIAFLLNRLHMESIAQNHTEDLLWMIKEKSKLSGTSITEEEFIEMAGRYASYDEKA
jgi:homocitrate synthase NifV